MALTVDTLDNIIGTRKELLLISSLVVEDPVALRRLGMISDKLVEERDAGFAISNLINDHQYEVGILRTLESWISEQGRNATLGNLLDVLRSFELNRLVEQIMMGMRKLHKVNSLNLIENTTENLSTTSHGLTSSSYLIRQSEVDIRRKIHANNWVVSIARLPDGKNPEHVFIIIEGVEDDQAKIWFTDLISLSGTGVIHPTGIVRIFPDPRADREHDALRYSKELTNYNDLPMENKLLYVRHDTTLDVMMNVKPNDGKLIAVSWDISREKALELIELVNRIVRSKNYPYFNIAGHGTITAHASGASSSHEAGYNCFTWAIHLLQLLKDYQITQDLCKQKDLVSLFVKVPSLSKVLADKERSNVTKDLFVMFCNYFICSIIVAILGFSTYGIWNFWK